MNTYKIILPALLIVAVAACSPSTQNAKEVVATDSATNQIDTALVTKISIPANLSVGTPIEMTFTVYNPTDSVKTFCKWHTPFEPLMSKYLDVTSAEGIEAAYKGPMAKRIMPPPTDSYLSIKPKDSLSVKVDLTKAYDIKAGNYTVKYNSAGISGLKLTDSVQFAIK
ncbi:protease [Pedobacter polaris]|uniref:Protease n=1 Tax=Pedobacter polaris TaxID=2571273 RepID=A0A4U1CGK3_9SPHI|nr:protease [Pedobacter polaris]TKC05535.1 protease [Pedobacter polaris]